MKRKINDKDVEIIKVLLSEGYGNKSVIDIVRIKHNIEIDQYLLCNIKSGNSYYDIRPDLNDKIYLKSKISKKNDVNKISDIKYLLTCDEFSDEEIMKHYMISEKTLRGIKLCYYPYIMISPEYNEIIKDKYHRRKKVNISDRIILDIKKQFIETKGEISLVELGKKHKIDKATVSTIISLKTYKETGEKYNSKISSIILKKAKKKLSRKNTREKISKERNRIKEIRLKQNIEVSKSNSYLKALQESLKV